MECRKRSMDRKKIYIYIYIYIERERERERESDCLTTPTIPQIL